MIIGCFDLILDLASRRRRQLVAVAVEELDAVVEYGLCEALITMRRRRRRNAWVRYAMPGVGMGPSSSTSAPAADKPASSADSNM